MLSKEREDPLKMEDSLKLSASATGRHVPSSSKSIKGALSSIVLGSVLCILGILAYNSLESSTAIISTTIEASPGKANRRLNNVVATKEPSKSTTIETSPGKANRRLNNVVATKAPSKPVGPKVFGVGLSKTGTTSLSRAMSMLGYNSIHNDPTLVHFMHHHNDHRLGSQLDLSGKYDAVDSVWDIPTAAYYKELHAAYPDAKFILTVRETPRKWYDSFLAYLNDYQYYQWGCAIPERIQRLHEFVYGSRNIEENWMDSYQLHNEEVMAYFQQYATMDDQLLVVDVASEDDPWSTLCSFLGRNDGPCDFSHFTEERRAEFPRTNTADDHKDLDTTCPGEALSKALAQPSFSQSTTMTTAHIDPPILTSRPPKKDQFAYVTLLCDPALPDQTQYIRMLLVLLENIRTYDADSDVVVMVHGTILQEQWDLLTAAGLKLVRIDTVGSVTTLKYPNQPGDRTATCYRSKFRSLQLIHYDKILFLDSDILLRKDVKPMFNLPGFVIADGSEAPMNAGFFLAEPSEQAYADIYDIWRTTSYTPEKGWMDYGQFPHWRQKGNMTDWTFWCATTDQGLLFYYYELLMNTAHIQLHALMGSTFTHFVGQNKPFLFSPDKLEDVPTRYRGAVVVWYNLWEKVEAKLEGAKAHSVPVPRELDSKESVEKTRVRIKRALNIDNVFDHEKEQRGVAQPPDAYADAYAKNAYDNAEDYLYYDPCYFDPNYFEASGLTRRQEANRIRQREEQFLYFENFGYPKRCVEGYYLAGGISTETGLTKRQQANRERQRQHQEQYYQQYGRYPETLTKQQQRNRERQRQHAELERHKAEQQYYAEQQRQKAQQYAEHQRQKAQQQHYQAQKEYYEDYYAAYYAAHGYAYTGTRKKSKGQRVRN